jgi:hypothetical protein
MLNLIAYDKYGRKFTNCTAVDVSYDLKGAGILTPIPSINKYETISQFIQNNMDLIDLK